MVLSGGWVWATATALAPAGQWVGNGTDVGLPVTTLPATRRPPGVRQTKKARSLKLLTLKPRTFG